MTDEEIDELAIKNWIPLYKLVHGDVITSRMEQDVNVQLEELCKVAEAYLRLRGKLPN